MPKPAPPIETVKLDSAFAHANNAAMDSFAGFEAFVRVVEAGSFTAAAARMQTAKSSLSETVRALEERLGVRLLERTTRRLRPTEAGQLLYARARRLIDESAATRAELQALQATPAGRLRVAAPDGFAERFLVPGLVGFLAAYPAVDVELVESAGAARLVEDEFDLAIRVAPAPEPTLVVRRLATSSVIVVAAPAYLAAAGTPCAPSELPTHRCVGFAPLAWRDTWLLGDEEVHIRPKLLTSSGESLRAAALAGLGLVALPDWMVLDALASGALVRVLPDFPAAGIGIYAVYPTNRLIAPKVRSFVDHIAREIRTRGLPP